MCANRRCLDCISRNPAKEAIDACRDSSSPGLQQVIFITGRTGFGHVEKGFASP